MTQSPVAGSQTFRAHALLEALSQAPGIDAGSSSQLPPPSAASACAHRRVPLHASWSPNTSSQVSAAAPTSHGQAPSEISKTPAQIPPRQTSPTVQGFPSAHGVSSAQGEATHSPDAGSQLDDTQGALPSPQITIVARSSSQRPSTQTRTPVHGFWSPKSCSQVSPDASQGQESTS